MTNIASKQKPPLCQELLVNCNRSEEHTSELQSRETISYAVFCLKKKTKTKTKKKKRVQEYIVITRRQAHAARLAIQM